jgi:hypothetical protein
VYNIQEMSNQMTKKIMPRFKFISKIVSMGEDKLIITVPKQFHIEAKPLKGKSAVIIVDTDAYDDLLKKG